MLTTKEKDLIFILSRGCDLVPENELYKTSMCDSTVEFNGKIEKLKELGLIEKVTITCYRLTEKGVGQWR